MLSLRLDRISRVCCRVFMAYWSSCPPEGKTLLTAQRPLGSEMEAAAIPLWLRILVMVLRTLFFGALVAVTVRLSSPQSETIWTVYDTPSDLIRVAVGFAVCMWIVVHFSCFPRGRTYIGLGFVSALWSPRSHWQW